MATVQELASLGGHPALNFLNSGGRWGGATVELLTDGKTFLDLARATGLLANDTADHVLRRFTTGELDRVAESARHLREWLRPVIAGWAAAPAGAESVPAEVLAVLNNALAADRRHLALSAGRGGVAELRQCREWTDPDQLLAAPVAAVADLLVRGHRLLVSNCAAPDCDLLFCDQSKSHRRRWCSMARCGNQAKVRRHRGRADIVGEN